MGFSFWHLLIITVIVLLLFGPNRLPSLGKSLGEAIRGFKKGLNEDEIDVTGASRREQLRDAQNTPPQDAGAGHTENASQATAGQSTAKKDKV
jgi:sec-independent protein translocase protein TatA